MFIAKGVLLLDHRVLAVVIRSPSVAVREDADGEQK